MFTAVGGDVPVPAPALDEEEAPVPVVPELEVQSTTSAGLSPVELSVGSVRWLRPG